MKLLNPQLYYCLDQAFGAVKIANHGETMIVHYLPHWTVHGGKLRMEIKRWGEFYRVCCPFCGDSRYRLYVNHRWAERDRRTGDDHLHLATCFNEECLKTREAQRQLHAMVYPDGHWADRVDVPAPLSATSVVVPPVTTPPPGQLLGELPVDHPVHGYLRGRGYDPRQLARDYELRFCESSETSRPRLHDPRLIIPIAGAPSVGALGKVRPGRVVGWQARAIRDDLRSGVPKYLSAAGLQKSRLLYGLNQARSTTGSIVLVEGILDAWRIGTQAIAILGKTLSDEQCQLVLRHCAGRPLVIWLDADANDAAEKVKDLIEQRRRAVHDRARVVIAACPTGRKDPAECSAAEVAAVLRRVTRSKTIRPARRRTSK